MSTLTEQPTTARAARKAQYDALKETLQAQLPAPTPPPPVLAKRKRVRSRPRRDVNAKKTAAPGTDAAPAAGDVVPALKGPQSQASSMAEQTAMLTPSGM
ncbi:hypothetical protein N7457_008291 [Penicillium paradoxum]|uniref:uncharacterized protein n=1 Tax=Penicillium paradoxum TaxID=176176 RepID=UPI0025490CAB|nr:uncharacterized protein N7457_008291 [Penicillium paradoxum]KAJ5773395.1 hypothetical protein N7457_008291 [Penicillium paradoxum]